jgi:hypothetical protein
MRILFNPSGTHVKNGVLKIRLDLYPDVTDKTYTCQYVDVFDREPTEDELNDAAKLALIPTHKQLNPCLCHFVEVPENIDKATLQAYIQKLFDADALETLDNALIQANSAHLVSPYIRSKAKLNAPKISGKSDDVIASVNTKLAALSVQGSEDGHSQPLSPQSITCGPDVIDRAGSDNMGNYTGIWTTNPANADGTIDTVQVWATVTLQHFQAGTFYGSSGSFTCRDATGDLGNVTAGSKQTFTGLSISVQTGDYIGSYCTYGSFEYDSGGTEYYTAGNYCNEGQSHSYAGTGRTDSIQGTGTESGGTDKSSSDSGTGADESAGAAALAGSESGSGAESLGPRDFGTSDSGTGAEGTPAGTASLVVSDSGQATEYAHILGLWETLFGQDAGRGSDSLRVLAVRGGHETGLRAGPGRVGLPQKEVKL